MIDLETPNSASETNPELFYNFFNSNHESLLTNDSSLVVFDAQTKESDRTLQATQVVDCIVIALWGKTKEGKDFISLIHKSGPSYVSELITEFRATLEKAKLAYLVIPGAESGKSTIQQTKEECEGLFGKNEKIDSVPELKVIKYDRRYDKSAVSIKGSPNGAPSILVVRPNLGS